MNEWTLDRMLGKRSVSPWGLIILTLTVSFLVVTDLNLVFLRLRNWHLHFLWWDLNAALRWAWLCVLFTDHLRGNKVFHSLHCVVIWSDWLRFERVNSTCCWGLTGVIPVIFQEVEPFFWIFLIISNMWRTALWDCCRVPLYVWGSVWIRLSQRQSMISPLID